MTRSSSNVARDRRVGIAELLVDSAGVVLRVWDFEVGKELPDVVERTLTLLRASLPKKPTVSWQQRIGC